MAANSQNRDLLVSQLAWQQDMGIDEILLDVPAPDATVTMAALAPAPSRREAGRRQAGAPETPATAWQRCHPGKRWPCSHPCRNRCGVNMCRMPRLRRHCPPLTRWRGCGFACRAGGMRARNTAANMVFADGNAGARLMVIGDVPGRDEDRVGLPLVGPEGQLFDRMLASIGLSRADCYIAPLIPWRPPGNRTPTAEEMDLLLPWLRRHIQLAAPQMLLLLGGVPAKALLPAGGGILKLRGRWHDVDYGDGAPRPDTGNATSGLPALRSPPQKRLAFADLLALAGKLG